jgi:hypothetical protein
MDNSNEIDKIKAKLKAEIDAMGAAELKIKAKSLTSFNNFVRDLALKLAEAIGIGLGKAALEHLIQFGSGLISHLLC